MNIPCEELLISKNKLLHSNKGKTTTKNLPMLKFTFEKNTSVISETKENISIHSNNSNNSLKKSKLKYFITEHNKH